MTKRQKFFKQYGSTIFICLWTFTALIISQFIVIFPMYWLLGEKISQPLWTCIYYAIDYIVALLLAIAAPYQLLKWWEGRRKDRSKQLANEFKPDKTTLGIDKWPSFVDIGLAPIGYIIYIVLANMVTNFMSNFSWFNADETQDVGFSYYISGNDRLIAILALVFIAPIAEEIIMRGWLYGKLREKTGLIVSILITSLVFAILHWQWNVSVSVFMLSLVLCSLREITGSIWSGMMLHMLSNGIAFYALYSIGV